MQAKQLEKTKGATQIQGEPKGIVPALIWNSVQIDYYRSKLKLHKDRRNYLGRIYPDGLLLAKLGYDTFYNNIRNNPIDRLCKKISSKVS